MISVLIPVFNVDVYSLVQELSNQLDNLNFEGELLVYDDYSEPFFKEKNSGITSLSHVVYKELDKNFGRIALRKKLAQDARFSWLLFLDCDSTIIDKKFLSNYLTTIKKPDVVYTGGRVYQQQQPTDCKKRLHWKYGSERESLQGSKTVLHSNNFCIQKHVFLELNFPDELKGYGHEDTWMELALLEKQKKIQFIRNPVLHEGLEDTSVFLEKTKNALQNLLLLPEFFEKKEVRKKVKLYNLFYWLEKLGLKGFASSVLRGRMIKIERVLNSCNPSLTDFDWYRLFHLLQFSRVPKNK